MSGDPRCHPAASPLAARRQLGAGLRRLREQEGKPEGAVAKALGWSESKISRYERSRTLPAPRTALRATAAVREVAKLLDYYGVTGAQRDLLLRLTHDACQAGWWDDYATDIPAHQREVIGLEDAATTILIWQASMIPPLLQTEAYAHHVVSGVRHVEPIPPQQATRRVVVTLRRQHLLDRPCPPQITAVLDEAVLRRPAGEAQVMHDQLHRLAKGHPAVIVRVLPQSCPQPVFTGSFAIFGFGPGGGDGVLPDVVALDHFTGGCLVEEEREAYLYRLALGRLATAALDPEESQALIHELSGRLTGMEDTAEAALAMPMKRGHLAGDDVLASVTQMLTATMHSYDLAGWFGGEECTTGNPERLLRKINASRSRCSSVSGGSASTTCLT